MILNEIENTIKDLGRQQKKMESNVSNVFNAAMSSDKLNGEQKEKLKHVKKLTKQLEGCRDPEKVNEIISQLNENNKP